MTLIVPDVWDFTNPPGTPPTPEGVILPDGYEHWHEGSPQHRPTPPREMFLGPVGEFALAAAEHTEADPVAIFAQVLAMFGVACGRGPHILAGNSRHAAALFPLIVGPTARGVKGTSLAISRTLAAHFEPALAARTMSGFGSGEAIIADLAPPEDKETRSWDHRMLVVESEFGGLLARGKRDGSTTSTVMRDLWDGNPISNRTKSSGRLLAKDYHVGAIGHITEAELAMVLTSTEVFNGFLNRWLPFYSERTQLLPNGGNVPAPLLARYGKTLRQHLEAAWKFTQLERTAAADELWADIYYALDADDPPGVLGAAISRAAPQCLRLSLALALTEASRVITEDHVGAAWTIWQYVRATADRLFADGVGDVDASRLLDALRAAGTDGLDGAGADAVFSGRTGKAKAAREFLEAAGFAVTVSVPTGGRPKKVTVAVQPRRVGIE